MSSLSGSGLLFCRPFSYQKTNTLSVPNLPPPTVPPWFLFDLGHGRLPLKILISLQTFFPEECMDTDTENCGCHLGVQRMWWLGGPVFTKVGHSAG